MNTQYIVLLGPTNAGKGLLTKLINRVIAKMVKQGLRVGLISFGNIVRELRKTDCVFEETYGSMVDKGKLVPDPKAIEIYDCEIGNLLRGDPYDIVIVDGFCRSPAQIEHASKRGHLESKDCVFMIEASLKTCLKRWSRRKTTSERKDDSEMQTFYDRYHLHRDSASQLRHMFKETDVTIIDIDGGHECEDDEQDPERLRRCKVNEQDVDGDKFIMEFVFPEVFSHMLPRIVEIMTKKPDLLYHSKLHDG